MPSDLKTGKNAARPRAHLDQTPGPNCDRKNPFSVATLFGEYREKPKKTTIIARNSSSKYLITPSMVAVYPLVIKHGQLGNPLEVGIFQVRNITDKWCIFQHALFDTAGYPVDISVLLYGL